MAFGQQDTSPLFESPLYSAEPASMWIPDTSSIRIPTVLWLNLFFFFVAGTWWTISFIDATNWCCHRARAQTRPSPKSLQSRQEISTQTNLQQKYLKFYQIIISLWMLLINILFFVCFFSYQPHLRMILLSYYQKENLFLFKYRLKINITLKLSSLVLQWGSGIWPLEIRTFLTSKIWMV